MFAIVQIKNGKFVGQWTHIASVEAAMEIISSLKISGAGYTFAVENSDGTIVEVVKM